jgi:outer membrane lipoprotein-sorting protein
VDQFLLVGFGATRADLTKTYSIALGAEETIDNVKTTRLELTPKSAETQKYVNKIQLWIPDGQSSPIQEKVTTKGGKDYYLFQFSDVQVRTAADPAFPDSDFELNLRPGVKKIKP